VEQGIENKTGRKLNKSERAEETRRGDIIYRKLIKPECRASTRRYVVRNSE
jgi:hypothetical protein